MFKFEDIYVTGLETAFPRKDSVFSFYFTCHMLGIFNGRLAQIFYKHQDHV